MHACSLGPWRKTKRNTPAPGLCCHARPFSRTTRPGRETIQFHSLFDLGSARTWREVLLLKITTCPNDRIGLRTRCTSFYDIEFHIAVTRGSRNAEPSLGSQMCNDSGDASGARAHACCESSAAARCACADTGSYSEKTNGVHCRKCIYGVHKGIYGVCVLCTHIEICMPAIVRTTLGMREWSEYVCKVFGIARKNTHRLVPHTHFRSMRGATRQSCRCHAFRTRGIRSRMQCCVC